MSVIFLAWLYATVGLIVGGYVYFRGVVLRPPPKEFELEDTAVLMLTALVVGVVWLLFVPALLVLWGVHVARWAEPRIPRLSMRHASAARARG